MRLGGMPSTCAQASELSNAPDAAHFFSRRTQPRGAAQLVAIVQPVHGPKFPYAIRFAQSALICRQTLLHAYYPVLSSRADAAALLAGMRNASAIAGVADAVIVPVPPGHWCQSRTPCVCGLKKLLAVRMLFSSVASHRLAITLDADTEFQSPRSFRDYYALWPRRRVAVGWAFDLEPNVVALRKRFAAGVRASEEARLVADWRADQVKACDVVHATSPDAFLWWGDAPVYHQAEFGAFWRAIDWQRSCSQPVHAGHSFEHAMFLCWAVNFRSWTVGRAAHAMQYATLEQQRAFSENVSLPSHLDSGAAGWRAGGGERFPPFRFLWSMQPSAERLILYNKDRRGPGAFGLDKRAVAEGMQLPFPAPACAHASGGPAAVPTNHFARSKPKVRRQCVGRGDATPSGQLCGHPPS